MIPAGILVTLIVVLIIAGLLLWVIRQMPLDAWIKTAIQVLIVVILLLYLLSLLPISPPLFR